MILQLSYLRQLWFYYCYTCSNHKFTIVIFTTVMILNCQSWTIYYFTIVTLVPIIILQLSDLHQLWFHKCYTCSNYNFKLVILETVMIWNSQTWANYYLTIVTLVPIIILQFSHLRQLYDYNRHTWANYDFTIVRLAQLWFHNSYTCSNYNFTLVILATVMILNSQTWANYYLTIVTLMPIILLQVSHLRQ